MATSWTIVRKPRALDDLFEVWRYLAEHDGENADRWVDRISESIDRLAEFPGAGSRRDLLPPDIRVWPVPPYLILYRLNEDESYVDILRVIDGRRDVGRLLTP